MAALNNTVPMLPKSYDLRDVVDGVDRRIEVANQVVFQAMEQVAALKFNPATGAAFSSTTYPRPGYVTTGGGVTAYEAAVDAALTALATAQAKLASIPAIR